MEKKFQIRHNITFYFGEFIEPTSCKVNDFSWNIRKIMKFYCVFEPPPYKIRIKKEGDMSDFFRECTKMLIFAE